MELSMGRHLARLRMAKGWTQARLADASGVAKGTISAIERGKINGSVETLWKLSDALGCPMGVLAGREDDFTLLAMEATSRLEAASDLMEDGYDEAGAKLACETACAFLERLGYLNVAEALGRAYGRR